MGNRKQQRRACGRSKGTSQSGYSHLSLQEVTVRMESAMLPPRPHTVKHAAGVITAVCVAVLLAGVASAQTAPRDEDLAPYAATPLPATIITREMIAQSGARSLREVVLAYVPGLSALQAPSEQSVAMRGVYGEMQQHILVLVDGHVLKIGRAHV